VSILRFNDQPAPASSERTVDSVQGIYSAFYGLRERPFDLTPNPRFLFLSTRQREALSNLRYGLSTPRGFTLLLGEAGCGKTTVIHAVLAELNETNNRCVFVSNPTLTRSEFYAYLARGFGLSQMAAESKAQFLEELRRDIEQRLAEGGLTGLVIDEAQSLPHELLEEIRLLGNLETPSNKLLNIVLSGQPELADRLNDSSLRQLKQRIALRCELAPFDVVETSSYIAGRLRIAGGLPDQIFTREAVIAIYDATGGLPRTINVLCDNALIGGFAGQVKPVNSRIVGEVVRDFDIRPQTAVVASGDDDLESRSEQNAPRDREIVHASAQPTPGPVAHPKKRFGFF
jgi:general secretion pathway protein A